MTEARALKTLIQIGRILRACEKGEIRAESALHAVQHVAAASAASALQPEAEPEGNPKNHAKASEAEESDPKNHDSAANDLFGMRDTNRRFTDENGHWMAKANADEDWEDWEDWPVPFFTSLSGAVKYAPAS